MTADVVQMPEPMGILAERIRAAHGRAERGASEWAEGRTDEAYALSAARERFPKNNNAFSIWLVENELNFYGHNDQTAMIHLADKFPNRANLVNIFNQYADDQFRPNTIWLKEKKVGSQMVGEPLVEPTSISDPPVSDAVAEQIEETAFVKPETETTLYTVPKKSKLQEKLGDETANVLLSRFKHARMFNSLIGDGKQSKERSALRVLAERCVKPDYPAELFETKTWTIQLLYPHLPQKFLDKLPKTLGSIYEKNKALVETERRFVLEPEFGVIDPPMVAFNKASAIYQSVINAKNGKVVDPAAFHRPVYAGDEGKPQVIICGTQLWPAQEGDGYCYDDLRCAYGLARDVLTAFSEPHDAPMSTKSLKLRHLMAWFPGGYNSVGVSSIDGVLKALKAVVQAYSTNKDENMTRPPLPSMKKLDE